MALHTTLVAGMKLEPVGPLWDVLSQEQAWLCPSLCHHLPHFGLSEPGCAPALRASIHHRGCDPLQATFQAAQVWRCLRHPRTREPWLVAATQLQWRGCPFCSLLSAPFAPEEQTVSV